MRPDGSIACYDVIAERDVMVQARDRVGLATDLYFPAVGGVRAEGRFPVLVERTPYDKRGLLPVRAETGGLTFALRELAARSRDLYGLEVNFRADVWPELALDETDASHLYRIAQEALTNAARHGHATLVNIFLFGNRKTFLLSITDDGEGIHLPTSPYTGMGLKIMRYRAGMIGAVN